LNILSHIYFITNEGKNKSEILWLYFLKLEEDGMRIFPGIF
jgi:hypothetical protein